MLLPKPGEDQKILGRKRDCWLQPHGLKLFMLAASPGYDKAVVRSVPLCASGFRVPLCASGFRPNCNAPEVILLLLLARETAHVQRSRVYVGSVDFGGFFKSICRAVQRGVERRAGVSLHLTETILALQGAARQRIDTGAGLTSGVPSVRGVVQGDSDGLTRPAHARADTGGGGAADRQRDCYHIGG